MKTFITSMAVAMLFAVTANADVIHFNDYEAPGAAQGTGLNIAPNNMDQTDGGGDHVGTPGQGISSANPSSGLYSYVVDAGATANNGTPWGGATWSTVRSTSGLSTGGFGVEADIVAAGVGSYINYEVGTTFTGTALVATDADDPLTGGGTAHVRLEFLVDGVEFSQADRAFSTTLNASTITPGYQELVVSYTLDADDVANGINSVNVGLGTDGHADGGADGLIYYDDLTFEVSSEHVVTLPAVVPEPGSACLLLAGLMGFCGVRRRKS